MSKEPTDLGDGRVLYIITSGGYSDFLVMATIAGPKGLDIVRLYSEYSPHRWYRYNPGDMDLFIAWLSKHHGCSKVVCEYAHFDD